MFDITIAKLSKINVNYKFCLVIFGEKAFFFLVSHSCGVEIREPSGSKIYLCFALKLTKHFDKF